MKKLLLVLTILGMLNFVSCTPESNDDAGNDNLTEYGTGQGEIGDPSDDDDEEGGN